MTLEIERRAQVYRDLVLDRLADGTYLIAEAFQAADAIDAAVAAAEGGDALAMDRAGILLGQLGGSFVRLAGTTAL
jgi:hypothetical protein